MCTPVLAELGGISGAAGISLAEVLQWLVRPQDGPVLLLLGVVAACGLLGLVWRK